MNLIDFLSEKMHNMQIRTTAFKGTHINFPILYKLSEKGKTLCFTYVNKDFSLNLKNATFINPADTVRYAYMNSNPKPKLDIVVISNDNAAYEIFTEISLFAPAIRKNGLLIITGTKNQDTESVINSYVDKVGKDAFKITIFEDFWAIQVIG